MKLITTVGLSGALIAVLFSGCTESKASKSAVAEPVKQEKIATVTEESLGLRKVTLNSEEQVIAAKTEYSTQMAGESTKIKRAFQDAPPMIPHDTDGMLPIKIGDNQCVGCHMPDIAADMGATPIPASHFTDFRPKHNMVNGTFHKSIDNYKNEVSIKKTDDLAGARFNCSLCHAPQSQGALAVDNTFEAQYTTADGAHKSHWQGTSLTDSLDTVGDESYVTDKDLKNENSPAGSLEH